MTWTTRGSRTVYENRWISVREDEVTGPGGDGIYGVVTMRHPAVFIVAVDDADRVCLVRLDRYTTGTGWEVPAGGTDGEDPETAARRELREETGHTAREWTLIGRMNALNGIASGGTPTSATVPYGRTAPNSALMSCCAETVSMIRSKWLRSFLSVAFSVVSSKFAAPSFCASAFFAADVESIVTSAPIAAASFTAM